MSNLNVPKKKMAPRDAFGRALEEMGAERDFVVLCADLADATRAVPNPEGKFRFMKKEASDEVIRDSLNAILRSY